MRGIRHICGAHFVPRWLTPWHSCSTTDIPSSHIDSMDRTDCVFLLKTATIIDQKARMYSFFSEFMRVFLFILLWSQKGPEVAEIV